MILLILILWQADGLSHEFTTGKLTVRIHHIRNADGKVRVGLFDNKDDFLEKAVYGEVVSANQGEVIAVFNDIPAGDYGISVIHDENNNGKLDTNSVGIPKEGFGFGNDATGLFGPPSFEKAMIRWEANDDVEVSVKMKYF